MRRVKKVILPKQLYVGHLPHSICFKKDLKSPDGGRAWGLYNADTCTITLEESLKSNPNQLLEVALHEYIHAFYNLVSPEKKTDMLTNESATYFAAIACIQFMQQVNVLWDKR